jgi:hypothetical protein
LNPHIAKSRIAYIYTNTIDPAFGDGTRRLSLSVMAEIEHTIGMQGAL